MTATNKKTGDKHRRSVLTSGNHKKKDLFKVTVKLLYSHTREVGSPTAQ